MIQDWGQSMVSTFLTNMTFFESSRLRDKNLTDLP